MEITSKSKAANKLKRKNTLTALSFIAPNFIGFFLFTLVPVVFSLILAFMEWDSFSSPEFVGMKNFSKMLGDDTFWISLKNTFLYTIGVVPLTLVCSLGLAILLNKKVRGMKFFRTTLLLSLCHLVSCDRCRVEHVVSPNDGTNQSVFEIFY